MAGIEEEVEEASKQQRLTKTREKYARVNEGPLFSRRTRGRNGQKRPLALSTRRERSGAKAACSTVRARGFIHRLASLPRGRKRRSEIQPARVAVDAINTTRQRAR